MNILIVGKRVRFFNANNYTSLTVLQDQRSIFYAELSIVMQSILKEEARQIYKASTSVELDAQELTDNFINTTLLDAVRKSRG